MIEGQRANIHCLGCIFAVHGLKAVWQYPRAVRISRTEEQSGRGSEDQLNSASVKHRSNGAIEQRIFGAVEQRSRRAVESMRYMSE